MTSSLPPNPNLQNLKNRAKTVLKRLKQGDTGACAVLRRLHRFADASDESILSADVSLADVQFAMAIDYGFPDWAGLKAHVESLQAPGSPVTDELAIALAAKPGGDALAAIIREATAGGATDTHLEWHAGGLTARQRSDGVLHPSEVEIPQDQQHAVIDCLKTMAALDVSKHDVPQVGRCSFGLDGRGVNMHISVVPYVSGEGVVIRYMGILQPALLDLGAQGWIEGDLERFRRWMARPSGLIIVTGPAGSGKTTTIYGALRELSGEDRAIVTAEDPVELKIDGLLQQQIDPSRGITYARAVRDQLRQAPNIMMVGEVIDLETAELTCQAALAGHLVFTTMHADDTPSCLRRLLDLGVPAYALARVLVGVVAQRVVWRICPDCRQPCEVPAWMRQSLPDLPPGQLFKVKGCDACKGSGFQGRTAIHELLEADDALRTIIARGGTIEELRQQAAVSGMRTLRVAGLSKAAQGLTTVDEVIRVCPTR